MFQNPSYNIMDVAEAIGPNCSKPIIGIRPGEKIHEEMITSSDSFSTIDLGKYYAILPSDKIVYNRYHVEVPNVKDVPNGFAYNSGDNDDFLSIEQIRKLIAQNVKSDFCPV